MTARGVRGGTKFDTREVLAPNEVDNHEWLKPTRDSTGRKPGLVRAADHPTLPRWLARSPWVIGRSVGAVAKTSKNGEIVWYKTGQKTGRPSPRHPLEEVIKHEIEMADAPERRKQYLHDLAVLAEMRGQHNSLQKRRSVSKLVLDLWNELKRLRVKHSKRAGKIVGLLELDGIKRTEHQVRVILRTSRRRRPT